VTLEFTVSRPYDGDHDGGLSKEFSDPDTYLSEDGPGPSLEKGLSPVSCEVEIISTSRIMGRLTPGGHRLPFPELAMLAHLFTLRRLGVRSVSCASTGVEFEMAELIEADIPKDKPAFMVSKGLLSSTAPLGVFNVLWETMEPPPNVLGVFLDDEPRLLG